MKKKPENQPIFLSVRGGRRFERLAAAVLGLAAAVLFVMVLVRWTGGGGAPLVVRQADPSPAPDGSAAVLSVNDASRDELEALPGIGPVLAGRIIARREENGPFQSREDLLTVEGIGEATYEKIRPYITF